MTDSESSRDRSRSRSPLRNDGPKKRRVFTPSPVRNEDEQTIYEVPTEFKRAPNFLANLLFSGSPGNFKIEEGLSFAKYLYEESVTNDINAGYAGECLPFGYVSFLELMGDIAKNFEFNYSLFISDSLKNNWEEAVVDVKEDRLEFYRGPSEENFYAKIAYDDIYHLSPLVEGITFNIFYENGKVLRVMHERLEVATIVYYMLWKLSENGRKKHTEIKKGDNNVDWEKFPEEVLSSIFERHVSSLRELGNVARVSKKFFNAAFGYDNKNMWKKLYSLEFNEIPYFKSGTEIDWRSLVHERCLIRKKSAYDALRCVSVWQRDLKIRCGLTFFDTHIFNCALFSGKWYYEFVMPETGIDAIQVGITTVLSKPFYHVGFEYFGVGDDDFSWSYDGVRSQKFHGNTTGGNTQYWQDSYKWGPGDCIRVAMNIDDGELKFLHNHNDLGTAYNFPIKKKVYDFPEGEEIKEPFIPYFPAITCQQSSYGGEVTPQIIIQRAKMRYGPPEGYTSIGELMTERQFVDKISLTHVPDSMVGLMISKQLQVYIDELSSKGLIETPPPLENVGVDAGVYAQNFSVPKPQNNDYGFDFY